MGCELCPRRCGVDRVTAFGICRAPREMVVRAALPHFFEEPPISGTRGSGTIFFAGCALHCEYCQNIEISESAIGNKIVTPRGLTEIFKRLEDRGVHNLNFVTPTHYTDRILEALEIYRPDLPIVWNTSGYERVETVCALLPYVDIFLTDFKYADRELAKRYSAAEDYAEFTVPAIDLMVSRKPLIYGAGEDSELLKQGVLVRHLVLPAARENTKCAAEIFAKRWKGRAIFSLMGQYTPNGKEKSEALMRPLRPIEYKIAVRDAENAGLDDFFVQDDGAVGKQYVPSFSAQNEESFCAKRGNEFET